HRLDFKNRRPLPTMDALMLPALQAAWEGLDALLVLDQVSEEACGVVTAAARATLAEVARTRPPRVVLAGSGEGVGAFRHVCLKPNDRECHRAVGEHLSDEEAALRLAQRCGRPVFCTRGPRGILLADPPATLDVPAYPAPGPIDPVGAGDSASAAIACAAPAGGPLRPGP